VFIGILLKLRAVHDNIDRATETDARLLKNVAVARRIGFADVILPGLDRCTIAQQWFSSWSEVLSLWTALWVNSKYGNFDAKWLWKCETQNMPNF